MTSTENKIKLNLRPSIGDKNALQQQPPPKLLINHGKPNFTINRSAVKLNQKFLNGNRNNNSNANNNNNTEEINSFTKVILKKPSDVSHTQMTLENLRLPLKKSLSNDENNEFLQKRKQIYEKIEKENSLEENGYMNKIENWTTTTSPIEYKSYVKKMSEKLENGNILKSPPPLPISPKPYIYHSEKYPPNIVDNKDVRVIERPIRVKNDDFINNDVINNKFTKNYSSAINEKDHNQEQHNDVSVKNVPIIPTSPNGNANFEQRTVVSFSKDLASGPNKYPDTIKVVKSVSPSPSLSSDNESIKEKEVLQELTKLKFDIDVQEDIVIKPVIRNS